MSKAYTDRNLLYRNANKDDDEALKKLLSENSMDSWVNLSLERNPSYFDAHGLMGESHTMIAYDTHEDKCVGMYSCTYMNLHVNAEEQNTAYLGELRVDEKYRNKIRVLRYGYKSLEKLLPMQKDAPIYITSIASENTKARRVLEANLNGMPTYRPLAEMSTLIFSTQFSCKSKKSRAASLEDIPSLVSFYNHKAKSYHFSPCLSEAWLNGLSPEIGLDINDFYIRENADGEIEACFALWDQRRFKQSVIKSYRAPLSWLRPLYNVFARLTQRVELPKENSMLEQVYISFFACGKSGLFVGCLKEAASLAKAKGASSCVLGLSSQHNSLALLKRELKANVYRTCIEMVGFDDGQQEAELNKEFLIQPEVALL